MRIPIEKEKEIQRRQQSNELAAYAVNHLPIIKEFALKLGVIETINQMVPCEMDVEPGVIFLGMIIDTLSGRSPLYRLDEFYAKQDTELLLGRNIHPDYFADHNVGRVLDKAYQVGSLKIFTEIARQGVKIFGINTDHVSFDTTSVSVFGDYARSSDGGDGRLKLMNGHSKDHRPDLKQFIISMLCVNRNVPIFGKTENGNASDKQINNEVLSSISKHMARHGVEDGAFIYVADSAMVTEKNLKEIGDDIQFISRLPASYNECGRVIREAVEKKEWTDVGVLAITKPTKNRPATHYKTFESEVMLYGKSYRAVVVHSSAHDRRRQKRIDRELKKELKALVTKQKKVEKEQYFCEADARKALDVLLKDNSKYYFLKPQIIEIPKYKRGKPRNGVREIREIKYAVRCEFEENTAAIEKCREEAGCFVLISNVAKEGEKSYDSRGILEVYKDQHGIEQNFGFLKDPVIVNSIFLKRPDRIEVLGLVLLLSLLIWRLIEHKMRKHVEVSGKDLPGWKNSRTNRPTSFMLLTKFAGIIVIKTGNRRMLSNPLTTQQKEYLSALEISEETFIRPGEG